MEHPPFRPHHRRPFQRGDFKYILLQHLKEKPSYGYEIIRFLKKNLLYTYNISNSQLYSLLKRLEKKELVLSTLAMQETRPPKRVFSLTEKGREIFLDWVFRPVGKARDLRIEFLAKIFFISYFKLNGGSNLVREQAEILIKKQEDIQKKNQKESSPYQRLVYAFKMSSMDALIEWLHTEAEPYLKEMEKDGKNI